MNTGLLVLRLVFGLVMAAHGAQKLFGWFGGYGLQGTGGFMESLGFRPGKLFASAAGFSEFAGGLLIALGLFGAVGPALVVATMIVAAVVVHWKNGLFAQNTGIEVPLLYATAAVALAFTGYGAFSIDAAAGIALPNLAILAIGFIGGIANLFLRRPPQAQQLAKAA